MSIGQPPDEALPTVAPDEVIRWSEALSGIARTGLGFTQVLYERERYEEVLHVAADMRVSAGGPFSQDEYRAEWMRTVGVGPAGYVTPKVAVGAVVGDDQGRILLVQRSDSGAWLYPTGWADVGYSPSEVAVKEVAEETGIECEPVQLIAVLDGMRQGFTTIPLYSLVFHCRMTGGSLKAHPLECRDVGFFAQDSLPTPTIAAERWGDQAFRALRGELLQATFDAPRDPVWKVAP